MELPVYILTLPKFQDRREYMIAHLSEKNVKNVTFVNGVENTEPYFDKVSLKWRDTYYRTVIRKGELSCSLGHLLIWKQVVENGDEYAVVLEDDININDAEDFARKVNGIAEKKVDADLIYLSRKKMSGEQEENVDDDLCVAKYSFWTNAYMITLQGAKKLLSSGFNENIITVDEFLPLMYDDAVHHNFLENDIVEDVYSRQGFKAYAFKENVVSPRQNAFENSAIMHTDYVPRPSYYSPVTIVTVATDVHNEGLQRFLYSTSIYGFKTIVLGLGQQWKGGDMSHAGGGHKVNLLKQFLNSGDIQDDELVVFSDSYDVIVTSNPQQTVRRFSQHKCDVLFSAEKFCWPDKSLKNDYPYSHTAYRFLNSGGFIGKVKDLKSVFEMGGELRDSDDDQLYYTKVFLSNLKSNQLRMALDNNCTLFQCNVYNSDLKLLESQSLLLNKETDETPVFIHGNGSVENKVKLNSYGNYLCSRWNPMYGFNENYEATENQVNTIYLCIIDKHSHIGVLDTLNIPTEKLFVYYHSAFGTVFEEYVVMTQHSDCVRDNFDDCADLCLKLKRFAETHNDTHVVLTSGNHHFYDFNATFTALAAKGNSRYPILAPMITKKNSLFSNFWGDVDFENKGYYKRSFDYLDIVGRHKTGVWNIPYVYPGYFISSRRLSCLSEMNVDEITPDEDWDMFLSRSFRSRGYFMFVDNTQEWGGEILDGYDNVAKSIVDICNFQYNHTRDVWLANYIHPDFLNVYSKDMVIPGVDKEISEPVGDVFAIYFFTERFCKFLIYVAEKEDKWSDGVFSKNAYDERIGNVELYPTVDTHLKDIGLHELWEDFVKTYIAKGASLLYSGITTKGINIAFIVKYDAEKQTYLKPHHDSSLYTTDIALNDYTEYEGGGVYYLRQKKLVNNMPTGLGVYHPGRLTHHHSGVQITKGKRYILVTFIN